MGNIHEDAESWIKISQLWYMQVWHDTLIFNLSQDAFCSTGNTYVSCAIITRHC